MSNIDDNQDDLPPVDKHSYDEDAMHDQAGISSTESATPVSAAPVAGKPAGKKMPSWMIMFIGVSVAMVAIVVYFLLFDKKTHPDELQAAQSMSDSRPKRHALMPFALDSQPAKPVSPVVPAPPAPPVMLAQASTPASITSAPVAPAAPNATTLSFAPAPVAAAQPSPATQASGTMPPQTAQHMEDVALNGASPAAHCSTELTAVLQENIRLKALVAEYKKKSSVARQVVAKKKIISGWNLVGVSNNTAAMQNAQSGDTVMLSVGQSVAGHKITKISDTEVVTNGGVITQ